MRELFNEWQDFIHIVNLLLKIGVSLESLCIAWESLAITREVFNGLFHLLDLFLDFGPWALVPFGDSLSNFRVESVELIKLLEFSFRLLQVWVGLVGKSEQSFSSEVRVEFACMHAIFFVEILESIECFRWLKIWYHRTVLNEFLSELLNINDKGVNVLDQLLFELSLFDMELISDSEGFGNEVIPILLKDLLGIKFISIHHIC